MKKIEPRNKNDTLKIIKSFKKGNEYFIALRKDRGCVKWLIKIEKINKNKRGYKVMVRCILMDTSSKARDYYESTLICDFGDYDNNSWNYFLLDKKEIQKYYRELLVLRLE